MNPFSHCPENLFLLFVSALNIINQFGSAKIFERYSLTTWGLIVFIFYAALSPLRQSSMTA